jgi:hypothetical protein
MESGHVHDNDDLMIALSAVTVIYPFQGGPHRA